MKELNAKPNEPDYWESGFVKLPRLFADKMFSPDRRERKKFRMLCTLFILCNHTSGVFIFNGIAVPCGEGELVCTIRELSDATGYEYMVAYRLLQELEKDGIIELVKNSLYCHIHIVEYRQPFVEATGGDKRTAGGKTNHGILPTGNTPEQAEAIRENREALASFLQQRRKNQQTKNNTHEN